MGTVFLETFINSFAEIINDIVYFNLWNAFRFSFNASDLIKNSFVPELMRKGLDFEKQWLMQDGATPHTSKKTIDCLKEQFDSRLISRKTAIEWPERSPDMNPYATFTYGISSKARYIRITQKRLEELKINIETEIINISQI